MQMYRKKCDLQGEKPKNDWDCLFVLMNDRYKWKDLDAALQDSFRSSYSSFFEKKG